MILKIVGVKSTDVTKGDIVVVRASEILGTPPSMAEVVDIIEQGFLVRGVLDSGELNNFEIDREGYVLIGPPHNGQLARAP
jgi:hypothetical protein